MKNIFYCVALAVVAASAGACSDTAARLSPTSPSALAPATLGSDSGGIRNSANDASPAAGSGSPVAGGDVAAGGASPVAGDSGAGVGAGGSSPIDGGASAGSGDSSPVTGGGESATGGGSSVGGGGSATGPGASSPIGGGSGAGSGGGSGSPTTGTTVTVSGVIAFASGSCPERQLRLQTEPFTIVTSSATAFMSSGSATGGSPAAGGSPMANVCAQLAQGATVSVTGMVLPQTEPSHSPTLVASSVSVN